MRGCSGVAGVPSQGSSRIKVIVTRLSRDRRQIGAPFRRLRRYRERRTPLARYPPKARTNRSPAHRKRVSAAVWPVMKMPEWSDWFARLVAHPRATTVSFSESWVEHPDAVDDRGQIGLLVGWQIRLTSTASPNARVAGRARTCRRQSFGKQLHHANQGADHASRDASGNCRGRGCRGRLRDRSRRRHSVANALGPERLIGLDRPVREPAALAGRPRPFVGRVRNPARAPAKGT